MGKFLIWDHPKHWATVLPECCVPQRRLAEARPASIDKDDSRQLALNTFFKTNSLYDLEESDQAKGIKVYKNGRGENPYVFTISELPDWIVKMDDPYSAVTDRVVQANTMRKIIENKNLDLLYVPEKVLAERPSGMIHKTDSRIVLAEKLSLATDFEMEIFFRNPLNKDKIKNMLKQLFILVQESGHQDLTLANVRLIQSGPHAGKLALFDTSPMFLGELRKTVRTLDESDATGSIRIMDQIMGIQESEPFVKEPQNTIAAFIKPSIVKEAYQEVTAQTKSNLKWNIAKTVALRALLPMTVLSSIALGYYFR